MTNNLIVGIDWVAGILAIGFVIIFSIWAWSCVNTGPYRHEHDPAGWPWEQRAERKAAAVIEQHRHEEEMARLVNESVGLKQP